jgi:hypothetical protein
MSLSRRRFVAYALGSLAALGVGVAVVRSTGYRVPDGVKLGRLRAWHYVVLNAVGERMLAPRSVDVGAFVDGLDSIRPSDRAQLKSLLVYVEHVAPLGLGLVHRFSALPPADRDRVLGVLETNQLQTLRAGFQALKGLCMMAHYRRDEAWKEIEYSGPVVRWT